MSIHEDIFDNDESNLINHITENENLKNFKKINLLSIHKFQQSILTAESDDEIKELLSGTISKVNLMTDDEWENVKAHLPLPCLDEEEYEEIEF